VFQPLLRFTLLEVQNFRLLCRVVVRVAGKNPQLSAKHLTAERGLWKHSVNCLLNNPLRMFLDHRLERREALVAHVAGVAEVALLLGFFTRHANLGGIDDDDVVARIHVRGERRLVFSANDPGNLCGESAEHHAFGVDDEPLVRDGCG